MKKRLLNKLRTLKEKDSKYFDQIKKELLFFVNYIKMAKDLKIKLHEFKDFMGENEENIHFMKGTKYYDILMEVYMFLIELDLELEIIKRIGKNSLDTFTPFLKELEKC